MLGIFKKKVIDSPSIVLLNNFERLKAADNSTISALYMALNTQLQIFFITFPSMNDFIKSHIDTRYQYGLKLMKMEDELEIKKMYAESVACKLLRLYLATYIEQDNLGNKADITKARNKFTNFLDTKSL